MAACKDGSFYGVTSVSSVLDAQGKAIEVFFYAGSSPKTMNGAFTKFTGIMKSYIKRDGQYGIWYNQEIKDLPIVRVEMRRYRAGSNISKLEGTYEVLATYLEEYALKDERA